MSEIFESAECLMSTDSECKSSSNYDIESSDHKSNNYFTSVDQCEDSHSANRQYTSINNDKGVCSSGKATYNFFTECSKIVENMNLLKNPNEDFDSRNDNTIDAKSHSKENETMESNCKCSKGVDNMDVDGVITKTTGIHVAQVTIERKSSSIEQKSNLSDNIALISDHGISDTKAETPSYKNYKSENISNCKEVSIKDSSLLSSKNIFTENEFTRHSNYKINEDSVIQMSLDNNTGNKTVSCEDAYMENNLLSTNETSNKPDYSNDSMKIKSCATKSKLETVTDHENANDDKLIHCDSVNKSDIKSIALTEDEFEDSRKLEHSKTPNNNHHHSFKTKEFRSNHLDNKESMSMKTDEIILGVPNNIHNVMSSETTDLVNSYATNDSTAPVTENKRALMPYGSSDIDICISDESSSCDELSIYTNDYSSSFTGIIDVPPSKRDRKKFFQIRENLNHFDYFNLLVDDFINCLKAVNPKKYRSKRSRLHQLYKRRDLQPKVILQPVDNILKKFCCKSLKYDNIIFNMQPKVKLEEIGVHMKIELENNDPTYYKKKILQNNSSLLNKECFHSSILNEFELKYSNRNDLAQLYTDKNAHENVLVKQKIQSFVHMDEFQPRVVINRIDVNEICKAIKRKNECSMDAVSSNLTLKPSNCGRRRKFPKKFIEFWAV